MRILGIGIPELLMILLPIAIIAVIVFVIIRISGSSNNKSQAPTKCEPQVDNMEKLLEYKKLYDSGVISQQDFDKKKQELLND